MHAPKYVANTPLYQAAEPTHRSGLSPNARELARQIALARELMQKQRRAEQRASSLVTDRALGIPRPSAQIYPMRQASNQHHKSTTSARFGDGVDDDDDDDYSLVKDLLSQRSSLKSHQQDSVINGSLRSRTNPRSSMMQKSEHKKTGEELIDRWKAQSEIRKLEARLQNKTREVADLQTRVDHTLRLTQQKERSIADMHTYLEETAAKQSVAKRKLQRYVDGLLVRAERAEYQLEEMKSSLPPSRPPSSLRSDLMDGHRSSTASGTVKRNDTHLMEPKSESVYSGSTFSRSKILPREETAPRDLLSNSRLAADKISLGPSENELRYPPSSIQTHIPNGEGRGGYSVKPALNRGGDTDCASSSYAPANSEPQNAPLYHTLDPTEEAISAQLVSPAYETPALSTSQYDSALLHPSLSRSILRDDASAKLLQTGSSYSPRSLSNYGQQGGWTGDGTRNQQDWDLDFLEGVMKDVLAQREQKSRLGEVDSPLLMPASINRENNPTSHFSHRAELRTQGGHRSILGHLDDGDSSGSDVSVTSVSQLSEEGRKHLGGREGSLQRMEARRRRVALFLVFSRLNTPNLLKCAAVCREWRSVSRDPALWQYVHLYNRRISSKFLKTLAQWCSQLKWLVLERLSPRERRKDERVDTYQKKIRGTLEPGLEELLQASGDELLTLKIVDCPNIITERVLWLCSCHCRNLRSVTYISSSDPVGPEVVWALGAGCRRIVSLKIPPRHPCEKAKKFSSSCVSMIGRCWSNLQALSVGGQFVKPESLAIVAKSCPKLQVLELDHMVKVTEDKAVVLCRSGLRGLHTLILKHTPITPSAIIHFNGACPQLTKISVYLSLSDFFQPPASPGQRKEYSRAIETLLDLSKHRILTDTLQVRADYK
ncbi:uncharacterized protein [Diadema setosum]|uniref:uncharacterized protein n=1 Tax=Diadema setosum TaxID=31175 RepID=UPI003B3A7B98